MFVRDLSWRRRSGKRSGKRRSSASTRQKKSDNNKHPGMPRRFAHTHTQTHIYTHTHTRVRPPSRPNVVVTLCRNRSGSRRRRRCAAATLSQPRTSFHWKNMKVWQWCGEEEVKTKGRALSDDNPLGAENQEIFFSSTCIREKFAVETLFVETCNKIN